MLPVNALERRASNLPAVEFALPLIKNSALPQCRVAIAIPVRNEAHHLEAALRAVAVQVDFGGRRVNPQGYEIVVLANNCSDDSAGVVRRFNRNSDLPPIHVAEVTLPVNEAHVGRARQMAMDKAYRRLTANGRKGGIIATTDGDTRVSPTWIAATQLEFSRGVEAVCGRIVIEPNELAGLDANTRACYLRDTGYRLLIAELDANLDPVAHDPSPRHHQHYNASFAVTTAAYRRAGGVPAVRHLEDIAFHQALLRVDARIRHSPLVRVTTSARQTGRATDGLSKQLGRWVTRGRTGELDLVESAEELITWFATRRKLRKLWQRKTHNHNWHQHEVAAAAVKLGVESVLLRDIIFNSETFGRAVERVQIEVRRTDSIWKRRFPLTDIRRATTGLRLWLEKYRHRQTHIEPKIFSANSNDLRIIESQYGLQDPSQSVSFAGD